eukprot:1942791-Prymnesium_polylepis.1
MNFPSVAYAAAKFSMGTIAMGFAVTYPDVSFNILWPQWAIVSHATDTFARKAGVEFAEDAVDHGGLGVPGRDVSQPLDRLHRPRRPHEDGRDRPAAVPHLPGPPAA